MELTINNLIKIIIGVFVVAAVVMGVAVFSGNIMDFFKNLPGAFLVLR